MTSKKVILNVEDNDLNRGILTDILSEQYRVLEAENGMEALQILEEKRDEIDLILLDVMMPVMNGYELLDRLKEDEELSLIPVIVMTHGDNEADEIAALTHGATDYVPKPYRPRVIMHRVASIINLRETSAMVNQLRYDQLTGLYTKEYFYEKVRECLDANPDKEYNIICTNYENFKLYNDVFGRKAGDKILMEGARLLKQRVGDHAICCRYGADRFMSFQEREIERAGRKCFIEGRNSNRSELTEDIAVKLGVYEIVNPSLPVSLMCDRVQLVLDSIKGIYNQYVAVYNDEIRQKLLREKEITDEMVPALKAGQFVVYLQPKIRLEDGSLAGAEALVRWIHPKWGFMSPAEFIPLFEKNDFITCMDQHVWETVCAKLKEWKDRQLTAVPVSVNISRADVFRCSLDSVFQNLIDKYELEPEYLHLEITESAYTDKSNQVVRAMEKLSEMGFPIEMDDFGSGYSSLNMLSQMNLDVLKLDRGFIQGEMEKTSDKRIMGDIINMAHKLQLAVVAEGIETEEQAEHLREIGCDYAQGYWFDRPMTVEDFEIKYLNK